MKCAYEFYTFSSKIIKWTPLLEYFSQTYFLSYELKSLSQFSKVKLYDNSSYPLFFGPNRIRSKFFSSTSIPTWSHSIDLWRRLSAVNFSSNSSIYFKAMVGDPRNVSSVTEWWNKRGTQSQPVIIWTYPLRKSASYWSSWVFVLVT